MNLTSDRDHKIINLIKKTNFAILSTLLILTSILFLSRPPLLVAFEPNVLPPLIIMRTSGMEYAGHLLAYEFRQGETFGQLNNPNESLSTNSPSMNTFMIAKLPKNVNLSLDESAPVALEYKPKVQFIARNIPDNLAPESLFVTVYSTNSIKPVKVLQINNSSQGDVTLDIPDGAYILLASLTWLPSTEEEVEGFAYYTWKIKLSDSRSDNNLPR